MMFYSEFNEGQYWFYRVFYVILQELMMIHDDTLLLWLMMINDVFDGCFECKAIFNKPPIF